MNLHADAQRREWQEHDGQVFERPPPGGDEDDRGHDEGYQRGRIEDAEVEAVGRDDALIKNEAVEGEGEEPEQAFRRVARRPPTGTARISKQSRAAAAT